MAKWVAIRTVDRTTLLGIAALAASPENTDFTSRAEGAKPRRISRDRNRSRPRANRLFTVPTGNSKRLRGILASQAFQVAEDDGQAVPLWQPGQFTVKCRCEVGLDLRRDVIRRHQTSRPSLVPVSPDHCCSGTSCDAQGDPVEPARHGAPVAYRASPFDENEERGLESVLGVVLVAQIDRQMRKTIGPCRSTSAANAISDPSSWRAMKRPNSSPSVSSPTVPSVKSVLISWIGGPCSFMVNVQASRRFESPHVV